MRVRPHDHRLHGEALQPRIGARLGHAGDHRLGGAARFGGGGEAEMHAPDIRFVGDVLGQHLDGDVRRLLQLGVRDLLHLLRRSCDAGRHRGNAVGGEHRLCLRLGEQRAFGARRLPHRVERSRPVDA